MMKGLVGKIGSVVVWAAVVLYLAWAVRECSVRERDIPAAGVVVVVSDSAQMGVITPGMVRGWISAANFIPNNSAVREVPVAGIEKLVRSRGFVRDASVYTDMKGVTHVEITQRRPMVRFGTSTGYDFYVTDDGWVLPLQPHAPMWLPVVTGDYTPPFGRGFIGKLPAEEKNMDENYRFLHNLINFVGFISDDSYWSAQIEQINITAAHAGTAPMRAQDYQVEIVPRSGNHVVMLGGLDGYRAKLDKLQRFYAGGLGYEGWDTYRYINLKYKNQIVCTK